jgi:hypothetical protein
VSAAALVRWPIPDELQLQEIEAWLDNVEARCDARERRIQDGHKNDCLGWALYEPVVREINLKRATCANIRALIAAARRRV